MNCEPGDLARIIAPTEKNPNLGKIVQCRSLTIRHFFTPDHGPIWEITSREKLCLEDITLDVTMGTKGACPDAWLKPYRPPALDKSTTKEKDLEKV